MSATWYGVTVTVEYGADAGPFVALGSVAWTDITADVLDLSISRGRQTELSTYSPGVIDLTLDNSARKYDTTNTAGTFYGKLLPRRRIRVRLAAGAVATTTIAVGYAQSWPMSWADESGNFGTVRVTAVDAFDVLAGYPLPGSAYEAAVVADSPRDYWPMQSTDPDGGIQALVGTVDIGNFKDDTFAALTTTSTNTAPMGAAVAMTAGRSGADLPDTTTALPTSIEFWAKAPPYSSPYTSTVRFANSTSDYFAVTLQDDGFGRINGSFIYSSVTLNMYAATTLWYSPLSSSTLHHYAATISGGTTANLYIDGGLVWSQPLTAGTQVIGIAGHIPGVSLTIPGVTDDAAVSHLAFYSSTLSAARIAAHYIAGSQAYDREDRTGVRIGRALDAIGWPSADRNLSNGETWCGPWLPAGSDALTACRALEAAEIGSFFIDKSGTPRLVSRQDYWTTTAQITSQATFGDAAGEIPYENPLRIDGNPIDFVRNVVYVTCGSAGITVHAEDATSRAAYGTARDDIDGSVMSNSDSISARQLAAYKVRLRKTPATRVPHVAIQPHTTTGAATNVATLIPLDIGYRVTVNRRPAGGSGSFSQACHIQGLAWSMSPRRGFSWSAYLAPVTPSYIEGNYLTFGHADYGLIGPAHAAFPGSAGDYLSTPDAAALDITGDLELVALVRASDWTPAALAALISKRATGNISYELQIDTTGVLNLVHTADGTTLRTATSTAAPTISDGTYLWIKATLDVDNGAAGRDVKFYTAAYSSTIEPTSWAQLGATVTTAGTSSIYSGTANLALGARSNGASQNFTGSIARAIVRNGIGGTTAFDFAASVITTHGQATVADQSSNAAPITANGNARLHPQNIIPA